MARPIRILLVTESKGWSGGAAQTLLLALWLQAQQYDVRIACRSSSDISRQAHHAGVPTFSLAIKGDADPIAIARLGWAVRQYGIDIVHAQHPKAHAVCWLAKSIFHRSCPLIVTRRVSFPVSSHLLSRTKYTTRLVDRFIAVSGGVKNVLVDGGVSANKVEIIYSAVDPLTFRPASAESLRGLRERLQIREDLPVIIKVANYSDWKGQSIFLEAAALLLSGGRIAQFVLVGRNTDGPEVSAIVNRLGIQNNVRLLGFRTDMPDLLALSDLSVNSAIEGEGLSGALRESLALGVPVVASDVSGNSELVQEGVTGRLVPPSNPQALANAIDWMLTNRAQAKAMAQTGKEKVLRQFSIHQTGSQIENLYLSLLAHL